MMTMPNVGGRRRHFAVSRKTVNPESSLFHAGLALSPGRSAILCRTGNPVSVLFSSGETRCQFSFQGGNPVSGDLRKTSRLTDGF